VLVASSERARTELGWRPSRTALDRIVGDAWEFARTRLS
jgi:UDP-glucose 4-epimerase